MTTSKSGKGPSTKGTSPKDAAKAAEQAAKQKIYDRVFAAPEWALLERMRVTGFWPDHKDIAEDPPDEQKARQKLEAERARLMKTAAGVADPAAALKAENERRILESRKRRDERRVARARERKERREAWVKKKAHDLVHAGLGVSAKLGAQTSNVEQLTALSLPVVSTASELSALLGITLRDLRFLTFHRRGAALVHYHRYGIPKKTGGVRSISAPKPRLKAAQHWVLENVLSKLQVHDAAHGFVEARNVVTCARPHVRQAVVVNMDLKDFFPSITFARVRGLFEKLGYSGQVATVLALLTTEPPRVLASLDGQKIHVALGARQLPQGAPTSPALTNALCQRLDKRLAGLAAKRGLAYTRYADDLTFSGGSDVDVGALLHAVRYVLEDEGFAENADKTKVMRRGRRQEVTGVVVNERPAVPRADVRALRALLHNAQQHGLASQNRDNHPDFAAHLQGRVAWVRMVDPRRGAQLGLMLQRALARDTTTTTT